jgi:hypothetical protein
MAIRETAENMCLLQYTGGMRRFSRLLLLVLVAIVIGFYPLLAPTPHRIDQAHFELIQDGMTKADVEAIFGVPPGQYDWAEADSVAHLMRAVAAARLAEVKILQLVAETRKAVWSM